MAKKDQQLRKEETRDKKQPEIKQSKSDKAETQKVDGQSKKPVVKKKKSGIRLYIKEIILAVINIVFIALLIVFLLRLPSAATELNNLRTTDIRSSTKGDFEINELELKASQEQSDRLKTLFPNEEGIINFVDEIEKLKVDGTVTDFSFASIDAIQDTTGNYGVPIVIVLNGSWEQIGTDIQKIQKLPYLFRPINITAEPKEEGVIELKYGGFLYVSESIGKN